MHDESSGRANAASGGPQRGDHRQENSRPGQGCLATHLDLRSPIVCPPPTVSRLKCWQMTCPSADATTTLLTNRTANDRGEAVVPLCPWQWNKSSRPGLGRHGAYAQGGRWSLEPPWELQTLPKQNRGPPHEPFKGYRHSSQPAI